ncbi:unnamed protein product [Oikopleura dioica]|uniref:Uncharacterized protein n=1 Tax=Oikopleura dioica TaxID=34765 RepID=E4XY00_OIKDI|nr:unnamed protein product [Oikopleura dioica]
MINRLIRLSARVNSSIKSSTSPLIWNGVVLHNHEEKSESSDIVVRKYRTSPHFAIAYGRKGPQITKSSEEFLKQTDFPTAVYAIVPTREAAIKFVAHFAPDKEEIVHTNNLRLDSPWRKPLKRKQNSTKIIGAVASHGIEVLRANRQNKLRKKIRKSSS